MNSYLDNKECAISTFTYRDIGFGKKVDIPTRNWSIEISKADFITGISDIYNECIVELENDDRLTGEFHPPYEGAQTYPLLEEFVSLESKLFYEFFDTYFVQDFLETFIPSGDSWSFIINSLLEVEVLDEKIIFKGEGYDKQN